MADEEFSGPPEWGYGPGAHPARWDPDAVAAVRRAAPDARRVVIVGAGAAGIHMATLLKRRGFADVTIFERSDRAGGKVLSHEHEGLTHELGACYLSPAYRRVQALLDDYGLGDRVPVVGRTVHEGGSALAFGEWVGAQARREVGGWRGRAPGMLIGLQILYDLRRLAALHRRILGDFDGHMPPRPSDEAQRAMRGSFLDFLLRHRLRSLIPVMRLLQSAQGYGYLERVPAFYGLLWNNPETLRLVREQLLGRARSGSVAMVRGGLQALLDAMVQRDGLDVRLGHEVVAIERGDGVGVRVRRSGGEVETFRFDLLFVAAPAADVLERMDAVPLERALFGSQRSCQMTTTLQAGVQADRQGIDSWLSNLRPGREHHVVTQRLTEHFLDSASLRSRPDGEPVLRVVYQYGDSPAPDGEVDRRYEAHYLGPGAPRPVRRHEVVARRYWSYFPHWDGEGIEAGHPWRVLEMQGENRTYWIGSSASFESLRDIVDYNLLLARRHLDAADEP